MEIKEAEKILTHMLDILPSGKFREIYPLNTTSFLPASKDKIKDAIKYLISFHKTKGQPVDFDTGDLLKVYVSLASFIKKSDFELVRKTNLSLGKLYTNENEEVLVWFSHPKNREEFERSNEISMSVMLEAKNLRKEIENLLMK